MNRLLSKRMSNIYLKVIIKKNWRFEVQKIYVKVSFWGTSTRADIFEF